jgi:predicted RNase H-like HicB family nuclease
MVAAVITRIRFTPEIREEDGFFIAICHELKVAAPGQSAEEATARLMSTLRVLFANLRRKDLLMDTLSQSGIMTEPSSITRHDGHVEMEIETV